MWIIKGEEQQIRGGETAAVKRASGTKDAARKKIIAKNDVHPLAPELSA